MIAGVRLGVSCVFKDSEEKRLSAKTLKAFKKPGSSNGNRTPIINGIQKHWSHGD